MDEDLRKRVAALEQHVLEGAINLNVTGTLLIALIQRLQAARMITPRFLDSVFDAAGDTLRAKQSHVTAGVDPRVAEMTAEYLEVLRVGLVKKGK